MPNILQDKPVDSSHAAANTVALVDGDTLAYLSFGYVRLLDEELEQIMETGSMSDHAIESYVGPALDKFFDICNTISELIFASDIRIAVQSPGPKFRSQIYPDYKAHRQAPSQYSNTLVPELRRRLVDMGVATGSGTLESDDLLRIWYEELVRKGQRPIICAEDKDMQMIPGVHFRLKDNIFKSELLTINKYEARMFFYTQLLTGDAVDNVKGVPKIGPKRAEGILAGLFEEEEFQQAVVDTYAGYFGENWRTALELNGHMIYLRKTFEDTFSLVGWPEPSVL